MLRDDQWTAIAALVEGHRRALVVQRTGWGKSAVYIIATLLRRRRGAGPTLIVSPLLALMRNQVAAAAGAGVRAATLNSANVTEWDEIRAAIEAGDVDLLLVSPERLAAAGFRSDVLPHLARTAGLLVIDEAHCISDWGHDFRPDYRRIRDLLEALPAGTPVLATTATANERVTRDVAEQLEAGASAPPLVLRGELDRPSLHLSVLRLPDAATRLGWLADHLDDLPGSGIIYTLTVAAAEQVATFLRSRGHPVAAYTGRTEDAERQQAEADLLANRVKALVATSALGMGFDKSDLGFVVHLGAPASPVAYYQQVGRAGRATERAEVLLLPGREDEDIWRYFASLAFPPEDTVSRVVTALADGQTRSTAALEPLVDLRRARLELVLKVLDVEGPVERVRGGWRGTGVQWRYDGARYAGVAAARSAEQEAMRRYVRAETCLMEQLRRELDDPGAQPCGRCAVCTGRAWSTEVSPAALDAARAALGRPGVVLEPRSLWPTNMEALGVGLRGRIPAALALSDGRALGRLSDPGWGAPLRALLSDGAPDAPVPDRVVDGLVQVLAGWGWAERPAAVVAVGSRRHPLLVGSAAETLSRLGSAAVARHRAPGARRPAPGQSRKRSAPARQRARRLRTATRAPGRPGRYRRPSGPAGRRHLGHRLDGNRGRCAAARGGRRRRAPAGAGRGCLSRG